MKLQCCICFFKEHETHPMNLIIDIPDFDNYDLQSHLMKEHTIDEIVRYMSYFHWQLMDYKPKPKIKTKFLK